MTEPIDPRAITELQARVRALEGWRAHFGDLLDEIINRGAQPPAEPTEEAAEDEDLIAWVHRCVTPVIARPLHRDIKWCPLWWEHTEAVFRFTALRRAWTELAAEPGTAMSVWIRDHLDPCLRELLSPDGPFSDCAHDDRFRTLTAHRPLATLPTTTPPT